MAPQRDQGFVFPGEVSLTGGRGEISGGKYQSWELKIKDEHKGYPRRWFQIPTWRNDPIWTSIFFRLQLIWIPHHKAVLVGGFKHFLFSPLFGEMIQFDEHIFQMGW